MSAERKALGESHRHGIGGKDERRSTTSVKTPFAWRETLARPFIPAGPSSAIAMPPLLRREPAA